MNQPPSTHLKIRILTNVVVGFWRLTWTRLSLQLVLEGTLKMRSRARKPSDAATDSRCINYTAHGLGRVLVFSLFYALLYSFLRLATMIAQRQTILPSIDGLGGAVTVMAGALLPTDVPVRTLFGTFGIVSRRLT